MSRFMTKFFLFKVLTVAVGVINLGFVADSYAPIFTERPFLSVVSIAFILSLLGLVAYIINILPENTTAKRVEIAYHMITGLLLFMTGSVFLFSVIELSCGKQNNCGGILARRYLAAFIGLLNGFLYGLVAWTMLEVKIVSRTVAGVAA